MNIFDPIHGFIPLDPVEVELVSTPAFQRLRFIHQMGLAHWVYPGATNKRFEHSLGTMHFSGMIYQSITGDHQLKHLPRSFQDAIAHPQKKEYYRQIVRLAALCHDLGHVPFSHLLESLLIPEGSHELLSYKLIFSADLKKIWKKINPRNPSKVALDIAKVALGEKFFTQHFPKVKMTPYEKVLSQIITDDNFGADRMDYLLRDARCTGLSYGIFDYEQVLKLLKIVPLPSKGQKSSPQVTIGIHIDGIQAIESLLLSRYFMFSRVYQNPKVNAFSLTLQRFVKVAFSDQIPIKSIKNLIDFTDIEVLSELKKAAAQKKHPGHLFAKQLLKREPAHKFMRLIKGPHYVNRLKKLQENFSNQELYFNPKVLEEATLHAPCVVYDEQENVYFASELSQIYSQIPAASTEIYIFYEPHIEKSIKQMLSC